MPSIDGSESESDESRIGRNVGGAPEPPTFWNLHCCGGLHFFMTVILALLSAMVMFLVYMVAVDIRS